MNVHRISLTVLLALGLLAASAGATELGDQAPPLKIEKWIKGGPVDVKDGKNIYVIEFWATWCGPCRASIPHLTELQKKYKDKGVVVVAVSVDEDQKRKTRKDVEPFVETMGEKMELIVVLDDKEGATDKAYMDAFVVRGIPTAFVIDKGGRIAWLGHSMDGLDDALDQILAGKYDLEAARKADKERRVLAEKQAKVLEQIDKYFELVSGSDKPEGADKLGKEVFEAAGKDASLLNQLAWEILTREGVKFRDLKLAVQVAKAAYDACEGKSAAIVDTYARALFDTGKVKEAIEHQKQAVKLAEDPEMRAELEETLKRYEQAAGR